MDRIIVGLSLIFAALVAAGAIFGRHEPGSFAFHFGNDGAVVGSPAPAPAPGAATTYPARSLTVQGVAALVEVTPEARADIVVTVSGGSEGAATIAARQLGDRLILDGGRQSGRLSCAADADRPVIAVRMPADVALELGNGLEVKVGDAQSVEISVLGCSTATLGAVAGRLEVESAGAGAVAAVSAGAAEVEIAGSGEVRLGAVSDDLTAEVAGSGGVEADRVGGDLSLEVAGSGDVRIGEAQGGRGEVTIAGSGDVRIGGVLGSLTAQIVGSGNVLADQVSGDVESEVIGSGEVRIAARGAPPPPPPPPPTADAVKAD